MPNWPNKWLSILAKIQGGARDYRGAATGLKLLHLEGQQHVFCLVKYGDSQDYGWYSWGVRGIRVSKFWFLINYCCINWLPIWIIIVYPNWYLTFTTRQGSRVSCLAHTGFPAFGQRVQFVSGSTYAETEQHSLLTSPSGIVATWWCNNRLDLCGRGEGIAYP